MPRVHTHTKNKAGRERRCGASGCGHVIQPGEKYFTWEFRYGGAHFRCSDHYPKRSELTQGKMSEVYAEIEAAEDDIGQAKMVEQVREAVERVAESVSSVVEEYREAAESFGGQGENAERADELESWQSELESFSPEEEIEPEDFDEGGERAELCLDLFGVDNSAELDEDQLAELEEDLEGRRSDHERDETARVEAENADLLDSAMQEAEDLLGNCPY
jgi:hypothetical protein